MLVAMAEQLFQVGVKALVRDEKGRILLEGWKRTEGNIVTYDLVGGRIDSNEGLLDTLQRELIEEIGVGFRDTPRLFDCTVTKLHPNADGIEVGLLIVVYEVTLERGELSPDDKGRLLQWLPPKATAKEIEFKYDAEFCQKVANL